MFELQAAIIQKILFVFLCFCLHAWLFFCMVVACLSVLSLDPLRLPKVLIGLGVVKVRAHIFLALLWIWFVLLWQTVFVCILHLLFDWLFVCWQVHARLIWCDIIACLLVYIPRSDNKQTNVVKQDKKQPRVAKREMFLIWILIAHLADTAIAGQ